MEKSSTQNSPQAPDLKTRLDKIVESYRKIIVLFDGEDSLSDKERSRCLDAGQRIYYEKQHMIDELSESLTAEVRKAISTRFQEKAANVDQFLDYVTKNPELRDADRLVFLDLADELLTAMQETRVASAKKSSLYIALKKLNEELQSIQNTYQEEVKRIFSRFGTRGGEAKREKWQDYVSFLKGFLKREQILSEYGQEGSKEQDGGNRGARRDSQNEIYGYDLPAKSIVLSFDDGPHRKYTDEVLAILKKYGAKALFFDVGKNLGEVNDNNVKLSATSAVSKRVAEAGHLVANHSYSHPDLTKLSAARRTEEINKTNQLLEKLFGTKPILFRPPYGAKNSDLLKEVESDGMQTVLWSIDSMDWADPIPESIVRRVLKQLDESKKGILLMHDIHKQSVAALPSILEELVKEDYTFLILENGKFVPTGMARAGGNDTTSANRAALDNTKINFYRQNWAVVIGVNDYKNWPKLRYCVNDANSIEDILINKFSFKKSNIIKLLNEEATHDRIIAALDQLTDSNKVSKDDRVFFFFAGHGATRKLPSGKELGYIVPVDADVEASQARSISMTQLQEFCELIPAKHLYFVVDSCYSGLALTRGGSLPARSKNYLEEITKRVARQILTAGGADQQVADNGPEGHSIFTWALLQGLQGVADTDGNGAITASELGAYVSPVVSSLSRQTPVFGNLVGSEGGEFIFELQDESLTEVSKQLDEEAIKLNTELEHIHKELAAKRERNIKLRQQVEEERAKLVGESPKADTRGAKAQPSHAQSHNTVGLNYYREKKYDEAVKEFEQGVKLDPKSATIANNLGFTLYKMDKYEDSIVWLKKAIDLDMRRAVAYVNLADAYLKLGKIKEARENYEQYLQLSPQGLSSNYATQKIEELKGKE